MVRLHGPLSRPELARRTRLTAQAITNIAAGLLAEGLLLENGRRRIGRGQPPRELVVNPKGGHTIGIEIAPGGLHCVLVDLGGKVQADLRVDLPAATPAHVLPALKREVRRLVRSRRAAGAPALLGAGIVMPGPFEATGPRSGGPTELPGWSHVDAARLLGDALAMPVIIENDATAASVGEHLHGVAHGARTFCLIHLGVGLGLGIFLDGRPFKGAGGNAGELGHVVVRPDGRPCFCGQAGCLERYVSMDALGEHLGAAPGRARFEATRPAVLVERLGQRDPLLEEWIVMAAEQLRPVAAMLTGLFDPEAIVLGGAGPDLLLDRLLAAMRPAEGRPRPSAVPLLRATTGRLAPALGAAALPLLQTVAPALDAVPAARRGGKVE